MFDSSFQIQKDTIMFETALEIFLMLEVIIPIILAVIMIIFFSVDGTFSGFSRWRQSSANSKWKQLANEPDEDASEIL